MPGLMRAAHLDDFTLLRYTARDLDEPDRRQAEEHLQSCPECETTLASIECLDRELKAVASGIPAAGDLSPDDPFARRPKHRPPPAPSPRGDFAKLAAAALEASERAGDSSVRILAAARGEAGELAALMDGLALSDAGDRFALLYALQEAGRQIAENPLRALGLAQAAIAALERAAPGGDPNGASERMVPLRALEAQACLLAGQAANWTGELEAARKRFEEAYRGFAESTGDEVSFAMVEYSESQRRSFAGLPGEGALLARRAAASFAAAGLEDYVARSRVAEGIALAKLNREEEALAAFRAAAAVFLERQLWSNYVGAVNAAGACLMRAGRLAEARREFARALKSVSRDRHAAWVPYIRNGLANVLFSAGSYADAAKAFSQTARLFAELNLVGQTLIASLYEIESWALAGDHARAGHRLELFRAEVARHRALDPAIIGQLEAALSGENPDFREIANLRQRAEEILRDRFEKNRAS